MKSKACNKPCKECPFRRASAAGWLGSASPEEFLGATQYTRMPCHLTVDYEDPDWPVKQQQAPMCAGALIFLKNSCTQPREPQMADAVDQTEQDTTEIFQWPSEFINHHRSSPVKSWEIANNE